MKKFVSAILTFCLCITCLFAFTACNQTPPPSTPPATPPGPSGPSASMTNAEKALAYKQIAVDTWASLGIDDPTTTTAPILTTLPDKKVEIDAEDPTKAGEVLNIKLNASSIAGLLYMLGLLYENPDFVVTNDIVKFGATVTAGPTTQDQDYTLTSSINTQTGKVELQLIVDMPGQVQYTYVDIDYNFTTNSLLGFRFAIYNAIEMNPYPFFIDMALTNDGKFMWFNSMDTTDDFAVAIMAQHTDFVASASSVAQLTTDFSTEVQAYFDVVNAIIADLM